MGPYLTAILLGTISIGAAYFVRPKGYAFISRAAAFWLGILPVIFILNAPLLELFLCGVGLIVLQPSKPEDRAAFYLLVLPAAPISIAGPIPFPGINYLISLDFTKVACMAVLLPLLFVATPKSARRHIPPAGACFVALSVMYGLQTGQAVTATEGLRTFVDTLMLYAIPYIALARIVASGDNFDKVAASLLFLALIYAAIATISQLRSWNFYSLAALDMSAVTQRFGLLRISATSVPFLLGYIALLGLLGVDYFRREKKMRAGAAWLFRAAFLGALAVTVSRGAWLGAAVGLAVFWFFTRMPRSARPAALAAALFIGAPLALVAFSTADFSQVDQFGTFEYRREMTRLSLEQIGDRPLFGDIYYLQNPRFRAIIQGQGIVDIVNHYLEIALAHGLLALAIFAAAWFSVIGGLLSLGKIVRETGSLELERRRAFFLAALASILVIFATTSAAGIATHVSVAMLAVSAGFTAREKSRAAASKLSGDGSFQAPSRQSPERAPARSGGSVRGDLEIAPRP